MNATPIIVFGVLLSAVPEESRSPEISVVRTWNDLVQVKPLSFPRGVRVRLGISTKTSSVYGGVALYCLAEGLAATERQWRYQIGPLRLRVQRDEFSDAFWGLVDPAVISMALVGGHKCGDAPALFLFPVVVTDPSDAKSHSMFRLVQEDVGLTLDPATKPELTIHVFSPDDADARLSAGRAAIGRCGIRVAGKAQQPWLHFSVPPDQESAFRVASPAWDTLLPIPLPKNLDRELPSLFPENPTGELLLTHAAGKLRLKSRFRLAEDPVERLLVRYWRGGKTAFSKTGLLRADRLLKTSQHEYTIHVTPAADVVGGETIGVQVLYSELGWQRADPNSSAMPMSPRARPLLPVVSNRVDFVADGKGK